MHQEAMWGSIPESDLNMLPRLKTVREALAAAELEFHKQAFYMNYDGDREEYQGSIRRLSCLRAIEFYVRLKGQKRHGARRK